MRISHERQGWRNGCECSRRDSQVRRLHTLVRQAALPLPVEPLDRPPAYCANGSGCAADLPRSDQTADGIRNGGAGRILGQRQVTRGEVAEQRVGTDVA